MTSYDWPPQGSGSGGITSLNSDTTAAQTLSVGTSGTDFAIVDAGGGSHVFNLPTASASNRGALSSADWSTFNSKQSALTIGNLTDAGTDGIIVTGGTGAVIGSGTSISQHVADTTHNGYLSSTDWNTFNGKQASLTIGNLTDAGTDGIIVTGGTGSIIGSGVSLAQHVADSSHNGYLSSADWTTFNNKGSGTVTAVSVASANGFTGSSSGGATPALTLTTSITGILKGNGTAISAATSGTDYSAGTSALATGILKSTTTTGALTIAVAGDFPTLNQNTSGTAANITASSNSTLTSLSALATANALVQVNAYLRSGLPTGTITSSLSVAKFPAMTVDTNNAYATGTGLYTIPVAGTYYVSTIIDMSCTSVITGNIVTVAIGKNGSGSTNNYGALVVFFDLATDTEKIIMTGALISCAVNDTIGVYVACNGNTPVYSGNQTNSAFNIYRIGA